METIPRVISTEKCRLFQQRRSRVMLLHGAALNSSGLPDFRPELHILMLLGAAAIALARSKLVQLLDHSRLVYRVGCQQPAYQRQKRAVRLESIAWQIHVRGPDV
ncbi:hypothetical protein M8818_003840 [Zalaria obscura]|uniref:Uncharacterized protein n=1 Tax=Zalaria obscura TaxID=2024903 RepID=A0ACC3SGN2_9PEZI